MQFALGGILALIIGAIAIALLVVAFVYVIIPTFKGLGLFFKHIFTYIFGTIGDILRLIGAVVTGLVLVPLTVGSVVIGRWSSAQHFGRAIQGEFKTAGLMIYRVLIGRPAHLLCLSRLVEGVEQRLPQVVAEAPGSDKPSKRVGQFDGYRIVGSLPGGGSGGKLYVAEPDDMKRSAFERQGFPQVEKVVIKAFSLRDGSSMPQIVRESRALDAARKLGLVLEHELAADRFHYVTRYVPGQSLGLVTTQLHSQSASGLTGPLLGAGLSYVADLLRTLDTYHRGGLWHKDVKPDNIIVEGAPGRQRAHLVDFGLVTSLNSAMTLTTHGTEYFRDPEMVRQALRGVKVSEIDGSRFDIYGAGAVLYSVIENGFPAHGVLSPITRNCPEALRWVVRRAMTDYEKRYRSAAEMLSDLEAVRLAADPFAVRPADLPSVRAGNGEFVQEVHAQADRARAEAASVGTVVPPPLPIGAFAAAAPARGTARRGLVPTGQRKSASEQLASAQARIEAARGRTGRLRAPSRRTDDYGPMPNIGVFAAILITGAVGLAFLASMLALRGSATPQGQSANVSPNQAQPPIVVGVGDVSTGIPVEAITAALSGKAPMPGAQPTVSPDKPAELDEPTTVMVVVDLPRPLDNEQTRIVESLLSRLRTFGFDLTGDTEQACDDELVADVRYAVGGTPIELAEGQAKLGTFLASGERGDLALWIASKAGEKPEARVMQFFLVAPPAAGLDTDRAAHLARAHSIAMKALRAK